MRFRDAPLPYAAADYARCAMLAAAELYAFFDIAATDAYAADEMRLR